MGKPLKPVQQNLKAVGSFGPLLVTVLMGATSAGSELTRSRWEEGWNRQIAVWPQVADHRPNAAHPIRRAREEADPQRGGG